MRTTMTLATQNRTTKRNGAKPDKARMVADDIVTANGLATHLGMTRQNVGLLTANAIIEQRSETASTIRRRHGSAISSTCATSISGRRVSRRMPRTPRPRPRCCS